MIQMHPSMLRRCLRCANCERDFVKIKLNCSIEMGNYPLSPEATKRKLEAQQPRHFTRH